MYDIFRFFGWLYIKLKFRSHIMNNKNISRNLRKGGYVIAANHQKYYDPVIIGTVFRGYFSFMAKAELFQKNKVFAWLIRHMGAFPVVRGAGDNTAITKAIDDIINRKRVFVIFPEGKRSHDGIIGKGKSGVAMIASAAKVPVIPVCIMYGLCGKKNRLDVAIGEPIDPSELNIKENDRADLKRVSNLIIDNIKALQQDIFENTNTIFKTEESGNTSES